MDLQPVLDRTAAIKYVSKYASKPKVASDSYHQALAVFCTRLPCHLPVECTAQSLFAKMAADRNISAQEAIHLLLGKKLVECSRSFVNLNADTDAGQFLREAPDLDNDDNTFKQTFFQHYQACPTEWSDLSAVQYCTMFDVNKCLNTLPTLSCQLLLTLYNSPPYSDTCRPLPTLQTGRRAHMTTPFSGARLT
jgi:hypothetical protein